MLMSSCHLRIIGLLAIKTQVEKAEEEFEESEGQKTQICFIRHCPKLQNPSITEGERYHLVGEDDDVVDTTSSIARALNTRQCRTKLFWYSGQIDHGGPQRERNV